MPTLDWTSMIQEWRPPEKTVREFTSAQKADMNELLAAFGYPAHFPATPPVTAAPATTADDETPPAPSKEAELDAEAARQKQAIAELQSAIAILEKRRGRETPTARDPALDRAQTKADALAQLKPILAAEAREKLETKLAKKALRRLGR
jgi:hypothetical protein